MVLNIKTNYLEYFDFFDIAVDAYKNSQIVIYKKLLSTLSSHFHTNYIDMEKLSLELENSHDNIYNYDLDSFYDNLLEAVDNIKLLKNQINKFSNDDFEFLNLYNELDRLHNSLLSVMEKVTSLEIKQSKSNAA
jgi:molecular chaperone GrpE (heat shock protein)